MQVLLYDGLCGFCDGTVQFMLARDPGGSMRFAPLQGEYATAIFRQHPHLRDIDSLILVDETAAAGNPRITVRSEAVLGLADYLGGAWRVAALLRIVPSSLRDWAYDLFARHRYRIFGRYDSCPIPSPEQRARFIP